MKTLSAATIAEAALTVTRPGYLIQIGYSTALHYSTLGTISWNSLTWTGADVKVTGVSQDGKGAAAAGLSVGNTDGAMGAIVLSEGAADIAVSIWAVYAGATASGDPVQVFGGVTDGAQIDLDKVVFSLSPQGNDTLYAPRMFINQLNGFNWLKPGGSIIQWGSETYTLPSIGSPVQVTR
ncbi:MAG: hypothetical protein WC100_02315 [Sterolibacterium sp.]